MDEENKEASVAEEVKETKSKKAKKQKKESGGDLTVVVEFLTFFLVIASVGLQYIQFEKVNDVQKRLKELTVIESLEGDINTPKIPLHQIELFTVGEKMVINMNSEKGEKILLLTVTLGLDTKAEDYAKKRPDLGAKLVVIKEIVQEAIQKNDLTVFDDEDKLYSLKTEIKDEINFLFDTDMVIQVHFNDKLIS